MTRSTLALFHCATCDAVDDRPHDHPTQQETETMTDDDYRNPFAEPGTVPDPGGYSLLALMDDGGTLCERCTTDPANPVEDRRTDPHAGGYSGWGVVAFYTSGDVDTDGATCDHCGRVIVEPTDD